MEKDEQLQTESLIPVEIIADQETESDKEPAQSDSSFTNDIAFDIKLRGYDRHQVDHYIDAITEDYNAICEKCDALEKENEGLRCALAQLTVAEDTL